ncbi:hypothetical protein BD779DRAFT_1508942 [Infundibulicybe gibba]|nr:hypothetical protein BD779DRAFT_1508942 [Infundibulicybe gibba]
MRFSIAVLSLLGAAASVSASTLLGRQGTIPACAGPCLTTADLDGCALTDNACLCKSQKFVASSTTCIQGACKGDDLTNAEAAAVALCAAVGVTLTPPAASGSASGSASGAAASSTAPASGSAGATSAARPSASGSGSAAPSTPSGAASVNGANALVGLAAMGLAALAL